MTYELPDEAFIAAHAALRGAGVHLPQLRQHYIEALTNILAAHFERIGAEKMREAAEVADDFDRRGVFGSGDALRARADSLHPVIPSAAGDEIEEGR